MPLTPIKLVAGVDTQSTPTLAQLRIVDSQFIRWTVANGQVVWQKLGGWSKYYVNSVGSAVRCLWAWQDNAAINHLAIGAQNSLTVLTGTSLRDITPAKTTRSFTCDFSTTNGSNVVSIVDTGSSPTAYMVVFFNTPVSVGGLTLYGAYQINTVLSANSFTILAASNATANVANGGAVPTFTTTNGSAAVTVTLNNHGKLAGDDFSVTVPVTVGGITLSGSCTVQTVPTANTFTINATNSASSGATVAQNSGQAQLVYYIQTGPSPTSTGYGVGGYGLGGYGTGSTTPSNPGTPITTTDWSLANFGEIICASPKDGPIYIWGPQTGLNNAGVIATAPFVNGGILVAMPQQQLISFASEAVLGSGIQDPMLVRWCDIGNLDIWAATSQNFAGSRPLSRGSRIIGALQVSQEILLWTDVGVWSMQWIGGTDAAYGFNEVGQGCGLIGHGAVGSIGADVFWMSQRQFFQKRGGIAPLDCSVWDAVFQDLDTDNAQKIRCGVNSAFNEITWYYPSLSGGGENDKYVKYNTVLKCWDIGTLQRTAWIDQSILGMPIGADASGFIYQHETSPDADGQVMNYYVQSGYFMVQAGDVIPFVDYMIPDMRYGKRGRPQSATVAITIKGVEFPEQTPATRGPFNTTAQTKYVSTRLRARQMSVRMSGADYGTFVRCGDLRLRLGGDGRRGG